MLRPKSIVLSIMSGNRTLLGVAFATIITNYYKFEGQMLAPTFSTINVAHTHFKMRYKGFSVLRLRSRICKSGGLLSITADSAPKNEPKYENVGR